MGTYLRVLSESYPMNATMTGLRWLSKNLAFHVLWTKVTSTLEVLTHLDNLIYTIPGTTIYISVLNAF